MFSKPKPLIPLKEDDLETFVTSPNIGACYFLGTPGLLLTKSGSQLTVTNCEGERFYFHPHEPGPLAKLPDFTFEGELVGGVFHFRDIVSVGTTHITARDGLLARLSLFSQLESKLAGGAYPWLKNNLYTFGSADKRTKLLEGKDIGTGSSLTYAGLLFLNNMMGWECAITAYCYRRSIRLQVTERTGDIYTGAYPGGTLLFSSTLDIPLSTVIDLLYERVQKPATGASSLQAAPMWGLEGVTVLGATSQPIPPAQGIYFEPDCPVKLPPAFVGDLEIEDVPL
jgi:hypothetical protein